jgi:hypothetical protein
MREHPGQSQEEDRMATVATDWEETFRRWSKPSSETEQAKSDNAESMIRAAIRDCPVLSQRNIDVFAQGSYRNNTNVRQDSDVDICVRCMDTCFNDFSEVPGLTLQGAGMVPATHSYPQFKNEVGAALVAKFGAKGVTRGSKAFDVHPTSYRVDADVVAVFEHRHHYRDWQGRLAYLSGTEFHPDNGGQIINWPHQHYDCGVAKNKATGNRFKFITRVIKRLRNRMADEGIAAAKPIPSYFIECLVYNAPNDAFGYSSYVNDVRFVLAHLFNNTMQDDLCAKWLEVNDIKYLFHWTQPWTRQKAFDFVGAAWNYVGFE